MEIKLSALRKTWIFDLDGTLLEHNGYKKGQDRVLPGVKDFFKSIPEDDYILLLTARSEEYMQETERFLKENGLRYNRIIAGIPMGERILFNDRKSSGLDMAYAVNQDRDAGISVRCVIDESL